MVALIVVVAAVLAADAVYARADRPADGELLPHNGNALPGT